MINKTTCPPKPKRPGNPGYPFVQVIRLLVYALIKGIHTNKGLVTHLEQHPEVVRTLGLRAIPHRKTIARWKRQWRLMLAVFTNLSRLIQSLVSTNTLIWDSAPIEDPTDPDAKWGFSSRGPFKGFKVHIAVNQLCLPLRFAFSTANRHDSVFASRLVAKAKRILGDAAYDAQRIRELIKGIGAVPHIARNPRGTGKRYTLSRILRQYRYIVEQFNSLLKTEVLDNRWHRCNGYDRKCMFVLTGCVALQVIGIYGLLDGRDSIRRISEYR